MEPLPLVSRTILFYDLRITYNENFNPSDGNKFREFFSEITRLSRAKHADRYQTVGDRIFYVYDITFDDVNHIVKGKLGVIRTDNYPEIINMDNDETHGIEVLENRGLLETTHFVINYQNTTKKIGIESNLYGAKIKDFENYCASIGNIYNMSSTVSCIPIVNESIASILSKLNKISSLVVRVEKDNMPQVRNFDGELYSALEYTSSYFKPKYVQLYMKFDIKNESNPEADRSLKGLLRKFEHSPETMNLFDSFQIKGENNERNEKLELFNIFKLITKKTVRVQRQLQHKIIVSADIYEKIRVELLHIVV